MIVCCPCCQHPNSVHSQTTTQEAYCEKCNSSLLNGSVSSIVPETGSQLPAHFNKSSSHANRHLSLPDAPSSLPPATGSDPTTHLLPAERPLPKQFGRYKILGELGQGGMGLYIKPMIQS